MEMLFEIASCYTSMKYTQWYLHEFETLLFEKSILFTKFCVARENKNI